MPKYCSVFALSDTEDSDLRQQFQHNHDKLCNQCESLHSTLNNVFTAVDEASFTTEDKDEALFLASFATLAIPSWKCHFMRSTHQDQACLDVINTLNSGTVFIVNDWAMKFLPQRYRESQTDWFGKRGISWHISVVYRRIEGVLQWQAFIHVIQSCTQGSSVVTAIVQQVLATLKPEYPKINKAYFRQDNAGCYHSSCTLMKCHEILANTRVKVVRVDFSNLQGRKGAADWLAASCKSHIRTFINEGHGLCFASNLKDALLSHGGLEGVRVFSLDTKEEMPDDAQTIAGITELNNFEFSSVGSISCWSA